MCCFETDPSIRAFCTFPPRRWSNRAQKNKDQSGAFVSNTMADQQSPTLHVRYKKREEYFTRGGIVWVLVVENFAE